MFEGSLEVKLPTIWTNEKQRWEESEKRREEERRSEKRKSQKKEDPGEKVDICTYIYTYKYIYIYIYIYIHIYCIYIYIHTHICIYIYIHSIYIYTIWICLFQVCMYLPRKGSVKVREEQVSDWFNLKMPWTSLNWEVRWIYTRPGPSMIG